MAKVNDKQLEECFSKHLPYEIDMMRWSYRVPGTLMIAGGAEEFRREMNMRVECFCLHARTLIEFFKGKESSDFDPRDFTVDGYKLRTRFIGDSILPKLNEQLSHLSRKRTDIAGEQLSGTDFTRIYLAIESEISRMIASLTPRWRDLCKIQPVSFEVQASSTLMATNQISAMLTDVRTVGS